MSNAKNFDILTTSLSVLHNYFDSLTKLLFLDILHTHFIVQIIFIFIIYVFMCMCILYFFTFLIIFNVYTIRKK